MSSDQMEDVAPTGAGSAENGMQDNAANANSREAIMSREQAEKMNKDLKHYSYVPVVPKEEEPLPAKRQRKKINYKEIAQPSVVATPKKTTPKKGSSKSKKMVSPTANVAAAPAGMLVAQPAAATPEAPATDLERKKMELQAQLEAINRSLQDLGNQLQQTTPVGSKRKSPESTVKSTPTKKPTNRKTATPKVASDLAYTPVKSSPAKDKKGRPARERKKSIPGAFEVDEPAVKLSPSLKTCRRILLQLMAHHWAMPFNRPVDPVELQIPDYPLIIKNPMDLGTIKSKLDNGEYETVFEFSDDVHLTFNNAMTYNMPGSDVFVMADTLLKEFLKKFKTIERRQIEKTSNPYSPAYSDYGRKEVVPRGTPTKSGRIPKPKIKKNEPIPLSREEKVKLSATINKLPAESLVDVLHIIQQSMPQISDQAEEIEIDIDSLDTYTLRRLEKCVKNGMRKAKKVPKKKAAPPSRLEQAELAQMGTQQKIEDVQREIQALTNSEMALAVEAPAGTKSVKKGGDEDVVIDDDVQPSQYPPVVIDKEKSGSDSDSGSDSSTSSESGSDSNSDTESAQSPGTG